MAPDDLPDRRGVGGVPGAGRRGSRAGGGGGGIVQGTRVKEGRGWGRRGSPATLPRGCILRFTLLPYLRRSIGEGMDFSFGSAARRKETTRPPRLRHSNL